MSNEAKKMIVSAMEGDFASFSSVAKETINKNVAAKFGDMKDRIEKSEASKFTKRAMG